MIGIIGLFVAGAAILAGVILAWISRAPAGWQDDSGFHFGDERARNCQTDRSVGEAERGVVHAQDNGQ